MNTTYLPSLKLVASTRHLPYKIVRQEITKLNILTVSSLYVPSLIMRADSSITLQFISRSLQNSFMRSIISIMLKGKQQRFVSKLIKSNNNSRLKLKWKSLFKLNKIESTGACTYQAIQFSLVSVSSCLPRFCCRSSVALGLSTDFLPRLNLPKLS